MLLPHTLKLFFFNLDFLKVNQLLAAASVIELAVVISPGKKKKKFLRGLSAEVTPPLPFPSVAFSCPHLHRRALAVRPVVLARWISNAASCLIACRGRPQALAHSLRLRILTLCKHDNWYGKTHIDAVVVAKRSVSRSPRPRCLFTSPPPFIS